jgi:hypothetical protein
MSPVMTGVPRAVIYDLTRLPENVDSLRANLRQMCSRRSREVAHEARPPQQRVFDCGENSASSIRAAGFQPFLRCSATTLVKMPPRT